MSDSREMVLFASVARTASEDGAEQFTQMRGKGLHLVLDITAASGTSPTLDVKIQRKDPASGGWVDMEGAAFDQKTAAGTDDLTIYPGIAETANRSVSDIITQSWRAVAAIGGTTPSFTFSLGATYLP